MIDVYSNLSDIISQNPSAADILMSYGIPYYGNVENQLSSLHDIAIRYGVDPDSIVNQINDIGMNSLY